MELPPMRPPTAPMPQTRIYPSSVLSHSSMSHASPQHPQAHAQQQQQHQQQQLSGINQPHNNDVLSGRGVTTNRHVGNENFRSLVNCNKELYVTSTKKQKMRISRSIVEAVRQLDPPGRFLEKDPSSGKWFDVGNKKAIEKTSQALRDGAAGLRKQLSEDLSDPDFLSAVFDMDIIPEKKAGTVSAKKDSIGTTKKAPPKKGHRRTRSNPSVGTVRSKAMIKKQQRMNELHIPASPKSRNSINLPMIPKPLQSPMSSPRSGPASPRIVHSTGPAHRRAHSQGSMPFPPLLSSPGSYSHSHSHSHGGNPPPSLPYYPHHGPPPPHSRSGSFEYHDHPESRRYPPPHGSPYHGSPHPPPPPPPPHGPYGSHPPSPSSHGPPSYHPPLPPRGYGPPPGSPSPRFSPRQFTHHPTPPGHPPSGPSPTLSPYVHHPGHGADFRRSPDYHPSSAYSSPRGPYSRASSGYSSNLAVPALGGEHGLSTRHPLPLSPMRYPPPSPRGYTNRSNSSSPLAGQAPVDFTPPTSARRTPSPMQLAMMDSRGSPRIDESSTVGISFGGPNMPSGIITSSGTAGGRPPSRPSPINTAPKHLAPKDYRPRSSPEKTSSISPAGVVDVAPKDEVVREELMLSPSVHSSNLNKSKDDEEFPFDESPNPAVDGEAGSAGGSGKDSATNGAADATMKPHNDFGDFGDDSDTPLSPLPFDHHEDPTTLLELPENILSLPISPCGPDEYGEI